MIAPLRRRHFTWFVVLTLLLPALVALVLLARPDFPADSLAAVPAPALPGQAAATDGGGLAQGAQTEGASIDGASAVGASAQEATSGDNTSRESVLGEPGS